MSDLTVGSTSIGLEFEHVTISIYFERVGFSISRPHCEIPKHRSTHIQESQTKSFSFISLKKCSSRTVELICHQ